MNDPFDLAKKLAQGNPINPLPKAAENATVIQTRDPAEALEQLINLIGGVTFLGTLPRVLDFRPEFLDAYLKEWEDRYGDNPDPRAAASLELTRKMVKILKEFGQIIQEQNDEYLAVCKEYGFKP